MTGFKPYLDKVAEGTPLTADESAAAFELMMAGAVSVPQMAGFLMGLRVRGETVDEIAGAVRTMRGRMLRVAAPDGAIDVVGTGGDAKGTYNVSTCTAFVVAGAGVPVAKHGNRAVSSKAGAADVLEALGVDIAMGPDKSACAIAEAGVGFLFAPAHHAAMKHVAPARQELGIRTIFNLLGPLSNPAGVRRQVVGVFAERWLRPVAEVLQSLGAERAWVVHGSDGTDELTTTGPTRVVALTDGILEELTVTPEQAGLSRVPLAQLLGGDAAHNAAAIRAVLAGEPGPFRDVVLLNAAAALIVAGRAETLRDGAALAAEAVDSGRAAESLARLAAISNA